MASVPDLSAPDLATTLELDPSSGRARWWRVLWTMLLVLSLAVVLWWWFQWRASGPEIVYRTDTVARGRLTIEVSTTGALEPLTQVSVGTEISGIIDSVAVADNDRVVAGQVLATLNTDKLRAQLEQQHAGRDAAEARLRQSRASLAEARLELERLEDIWTQSAGRLPARREIDLARTAVVRAEADEASAIAGLAQANAAIDATGIDLSKATIRSPITGIVLDRQVDPGQTVAASFQTPVLFTLAEDLARMRLSVAIDEADIGQVAVGQTAVFTVEAYPGRQFSSTVVEVRNLPQTANNVVTYEARLDVDNADLLLKPGMTATADITVTEIADALLLPNAALRFEPPSTVVSEETAPDADRGLIGALMPRPPGRGGGPGRAGGEGRGAAGTTAPQRVWILERDILTPVTVEVGVSDGSFTEILSGLLVEGSQVVVDYDAGSGS